MPSLLYAKSHKEKFVIIFPDELYAELDKIQFIKLIFIPQILPALSIQLREKYKHNPPKQYMVESIKPVLYSNHYLIKVNGIEYKISKDVKKCNAKNSYSVVNHQLLTQSVNQKDPDLKVVSDATDQPVALPVAKNPDQKLIIQRETNEDILDSVKAEFFKFCQAVAKELDATRFDAKEFDAKKVKVAKHLQVMPTTHEANAIVDFDAIERSRFLANIGTSTFNTFYAKLKKVLLKIKPVDIDSINSKRKTQLAIEFCECFEILNQAGFYNVNGKPINFWSGPEAQREANNTLTSLSDSNVPAIAMMIHLGELLKDKHQEISIILCGGGSAVFASQAAGHVMVLMSGYNKNEPYAINAGNFHWNNELGLLQRLWMLRIVKSITIRFYNKHLKNWMPPVDYNDKKNGHLIKVIRRDAYIKTPYRIMHDRNPSRYNWTTNRDRPREATDFKMLRKVCDRLRYFKNVQKIIDPDEKIEALKKKKTAEIVTYWKSYKK